MIVTHAVLRGHLQDQHGAVIGCFHTSAMLVERRRSGGHVVGKQFRHTQRHNLRRWRGRIDARMPGLHARVAIAGDAAVQCYSLLTWTRYLLLRTPY